MPSTSFSSGPVSSGYASSRPRPDRLSIGDEVVSAGGIYGRVVAIDNDVAEVEVAPGVVMTFLPALDQRPARTPRRPTRASPLRRNSPGVSGNNAERGAGR